MYYSVTGGRCSHKAHAAGATKIYFSLLQIKNCSFACNSHIFNFIEKNDFETVPLALKEKGQKFELVTLLSKEVSQL